MLRGVDERQLAEIRERLKYDTPFWAKHLAKIIDPNFREVPLVAFPWQLELDQALEAQRQAGRPMRAIILKARKLGFSTWVAAKMMQRCTQHRFQKGLVVAHDNDTAGELFDIGQRMYEGLEDDPALKPVLTHQRNSKGGMKYLKWESIGSSIEIDTAKNVQGGRGYTPSMLHLSEFAFYDDVRKLIALMNAVPDTPETIVVIESTANGFNHFRQAWRRAENGESDYTPIFAPWWKYPDYRRRFVDAEERHEFEQTIGQGEIGEDEPELLENFLEPHCEKHGWDPLEFLHWRRRAIVDKNNSDVQSFHQEYPSYPEEAFLSTGRKVFSPVLVTRVLKRVEETDPQFPQPRLTPDELLDLNLDRHYRGLPPVDKCPEGPHDAACATCGRLHGPHVGVLVASEEREVKTKEGTLIVPTAARFVPREATGFGHQHPYWKVWEHPTDPTVEDDLPPDERGPHRPGQYIVPVDVSGGEEMTDRGDRAYNAIQVIDHVTKRQVASFRDRRDPHELAREILLAGLYWNTGLVAPEVTGGWGWPPTRRLHREYRYGNLYRPRAQSRREEEQERLGWRTDVNTRPDMEAHMIRLLSERRDGIRCRLTAHELTVHVRDERGRTGPEHDEFNDLLMAYMIGQLIALERMPLPNRRPGEIRNIAAPPRG